MSWSSSGATTVSTSGKDDLGWSLASPVTPTMVVSCSPPSSNLLRAPAHPWELRMPVASSTSFSILAPMDTADHRESGPSHPDHVLPSSATTSNSFRWAGRPPFSAAQRSADGNCRVQPWIHLNDLPNPACEAGSSASYSCGCVPDLKVGPTEHGLPADVVSDSPIASHPGPYPVFPAAGPPHYAVLQPGVL